MCVNKGVWPGCQTASAKRKLSRVQRLACLGITGAMRNYPPVLWKLSFASPHWSWWFRVRLVQLRIDYEVRDEGLTYNPTEDTAVFWCGFKSKIPYLLWGLKLWGQHKTLNPNIGLPCWREDWTKATFAPPAVKRFICFTNGSTMMDGTGAGICGQSVWRSLSFSLGSYAQVFRRRFMLS